MGRVHEGPRGGGALERVVVVGDSLGVGTEQYLRQDLGGRRVTANSKVGRTSAQAVDVLEDTIRPGDQAVVFDVGTNDASAGALRQSVKRAVKVAGGRPLYAATVRGPDAGAKNALLRRFADKGYLQLVPWAGHTGGHLQPDGIHATPAGYDQRGRMYARLLTGHNPAPQPASANGPVAHAASASGSRGSGSNGTKQLPTSVYNAINRAVTPAFGRWAQKNYGVGGKRLLALVAAGEGGGSIDEGSSNTSSAGARGPFQFIASTRSGYIKQYGIDAWKNDYSAARAAMIHLRSTGVAGYNPGMSTYTDYILGQSVNTEPLKTGSYGGGAKTTGSRGVGSVTAPSTSRETVEPGGTGVAALVQALIERDNAPQLQQASGGVPAPRAVAGPVLPQGYQDISTGPPPAKSDTEEQLSSLMALVQQGGGVARTEVKSGDYDTGGGSSSGGVSGDYGDGKIVGQPIDRAGVATRPHVLNAVRAISAISGTPITVGTGTNHDQYTTNGSQSRHWTGDAIDLPSTGKRLVQIGQAALIAAGMNPRKARKQTAGLYNINGWQIIFGTNDPALGGDHTDHVHVESPRGYKWRG